MEGPCVCRLGLGSGRLGLRLGLGSGLGCAYMSISKWPSASGGRAVRAVVSELSERRRAPMRAATPAAEGEGGAAEPPGSWEATSRRGALPSAAQTCTVAPCKMLRLRLGPSLGTGQPRCEMAPDSRTSLGQRVRGWGFGARVRARASVQGWAQPRCSLAPSCGLSANHMKCPSSVEGASSKSHLGGVRIGARRRLGWG